MICSHSNMNSVVCILNGYNSYNTILLYEVTTKYIILKGVYWELVLYIGYTPVRRDSYYFDPEGETGRMPNSMNPNKLWLL